MGNTASFTGWDRAAQKVGQEPKGKKLLDRMMDALRAGESCGCGEDAEVSLRRSAQPSLKRVAQFSEPLTTDEERFRLRMARPDCG